MKMSKTFSSKRHVLSLLDLDLHEINLLLDWSAQLKIESDISKEKSALSGKVLGLVFQKPSTRTRVSFETGMIQLGGSAIYLGSGDLQLSRGESIEDTARTLSLYLDCIVARVYDHTDVSRLASSASVPVINGLSDMFHPCQILADLLTIRECKNKLSGLKVAWVGDGNNVCNDMLIGCAKTGIDIDVACPKSYRPNDFAVDLAIKESKRNNSVVAISEDPIAAVKGADVVVTDTFISIGKEEERATRQATFLPYYQINSKLMSYAKKDAIFMHCLPAKRGEEVTADVIDGPASVVWQEAENRLHVQKALLLFLLKETQTL